jgi:hypothetical protein
MKPKGSLHSELGGLASASSFPHMLLAVFVATAVGAASGAAVVLSLEIPNPETPVVMRTTKTIDPPEAANSRIRPEALTTSQRPLSYRSAIARIDRAEASGIADQDASSNSSRSEPPRADTSGGNDGPTLVPRETTNTGAVTATTTESQSEHAPRKQQFVVHRRRTYSSRFASRLVTSPFLRPW